MEREIPEETLAALDHFGLPRISVGDRIEFLGFGMPDHFWDPATESYQENPRQVRPGERGTVTWVMNGQIHIDWDGPHGISLLVTPLGGLRKGDGFKPDRFRVIDPKSLLPGPRSRQSELAERAA